MNKKFDLFSEVQLLIDHLPVGFRFLQKITSVELGSVSEISIDFYKAESYPVYSHYKPISKIVNFNLEKLPVKDGEDTPE